MSYLGRRRQRQPSRLASVTANPLSMYLSDIYTISCNLAGIAGIQHSGGFTKTGLTDRAEILAPPFRRRERCSASPETHERANRLAYAPAEAVRSEHWEMDYPHRHRLGSFTYSFSRRPSSSVAAAPSLACRRTRLPAPVASACLECCQ